MTLCLICFAAGFVVPLAAVAVVTVVRTGVV